MTKRQTTVTRATSETQIHLELDLDGSGTSSIDTGIPFLDHMLALFSKHGLFDLKVEAKGDLEVDGHHTVEDIGLCMGQAIQEAVGDKKGITRYGQRLLPMDETLILVALDLSGRPYLVYDVALPVEVIGSFDTTLAVEFLQALVSQAGMTLHVKLLHGENAHHIIEAAFKGLGKALDEATKIDPRIEDVPSTKGQL